MKGRENASIPMSAVEKWYPPNTVGIISIITKNGTPIKSKYGTFSSFLRMAKKRITDGTIMPVAWCPSHDGREITFDNGKDGWHDYIEDWIIFYGTSKQQGYGIEFHTIAHYRHYGDVGKVYRTTKRWSKPTKENDTQFFVYANTLKKEW